MAKLTITDSDRLQLIGLLSVGAQLLNQLNTVDQAICTLLSVQAEDSGYSGHINDALYEADTHSPLRLADELLHKLHIEVVPPLPPAEADVQAWARGEEVAYPKYYELDKPKLAFNPMAGIRQEADGSYTDEHRGLTLEVCERCGDLDFPQDDSYGLCSSCLGAGHTPVLLFPPAA